jgi:hypothetical protein
MNASIRRSNDRSGFETQQDQRLTAERRLCSGWRLHAGERLRGGQRLRGERRLCDGRGERTRP